MASKYSALPFSYLAQNQAAPKTGFRKEEGIYGDLAASVSASQQQQPSTSPTSPPSAAVPPPVAAKPTAAMRSDADWRLRSNGDIATSGLVGDTQPEAAAMSRFDFNDGERTNVQRTDSNNSAAVKYGNNTSAPTRQQQQQAEVVAVGRGVSGASDKHRPNNGRPISAERPISIFPTTAANVASPTYESAADLIRAAAVKNQKAAAAAILAPARRDHQLPQSASGDVQPAARTPTTEDDVGGGIFDNFILVGGRLEEPPHVGGGGQQQMSNSKDAQSRTRLEDMFDAAANSRGGGGGQLPSSAARNGGYVVDYDDELTGDGADYVVSPAAVGSNGVPVMMVNGQAPRPMDRLPRVVADTTVAAGNGKTSYDSPNYQLYSGFGTTAVVATTTASASTDQYSPFGADSRPNSFNNADTYLVDPRSRQKQRGADVENADDCRCGRCCRCSRSTVCFIVLLVIVVGLVCFGVGFIAGWFGRQSSSTAAVAASASATSSSTLSTAAVGSLSVATTMTSKPAGQSFTVTQINGMTSSKTTSGVQISSQAADTSPSTASSSSTATTTATTKTTTATTTAAP